MIGQILPNNNEKYYKNFSPKFLDLHTPYASSEQASATCNCSCSFLAFTIHRLGLGRAVSQLHACAYLRKQLLVLQVTRVPAISICMYAVDRLMQRLPSDL